MCEFPFVPKKKDNILSIIILPHWPPLLRLLAQPPLRRLLQPILVPLDITHTTIRFALVAAKQLVPALQALDNLFARLLELLRMPVLELAGAQLLAVARFLLLGGALFRCERDLFLRVHGHVHLFYAAQIRDRVLGEAAGQKGARGVLSREEVVGAAGAVGGGRDGHVVDGAVEGEVDGLLGVGAVVEGEFGVG